MDASNNSFDCIINSSNQFCIDESSQSIQNDKFKFKLLGKIEYIISNESFYNPSIKHSFDSNLKDKFAGKSQREIYEFLREKAIQINSELGNKYEKRIKKIEESIKSPFCLLNDDTIGEITNKLESVADIQNFAQVNKRLYRLAGPNLVKTAQKYGYSGNDPNSANKFLNNLKFSCKKNFNTKYIPRMNKFSREQFIGYLLYNNIYYTENAALYKYFLKSADICLGNMGEKDNINARNKIGHTALIMAIINNKEELVEKLIYYGADVDYPTANTSPIYAQDYDDIADIDNLSTAFVNNKKLFFGGFASPLAIAFKEGNYQIAKLLLEKGAKPDAREALINQFDVNKKPKKTSLLYYACTKGETKFVDLLLEYRANIDIFIPNTVATPLLNATSDNNIGAVKLLLEKGANVNLFTTNGNTPLMASIMSLNNNLQLSEILLQHGADANIPTNQTKKATPLIWACATGNIDAVRLLLNKSVSIDINKTNEEGSTALLIAASFRQKDIVELLLENGADPNIKNLLNQTPLHRACEDGNKDIVKLLVNHKKTNINLTNGNGETPLAIAIKRLHPKIIIFLKKHGAH